MNLANGIPMTIELLTKHGFKPAGSCRCDGYYTLKYRKGMYEFKWRKSRYTFKIMEQHSTMYEWQPLANLEKVLNELDQKIINAQAARKTV